MSPLTTVLPSKPLRKPSGSACTIIFFCAGAIITFFASLISALEILTISPIPDLEFLLMIPSILIIPSPTSAGYALSATATVSLFPLMIITSPLLIPSSLITSPSIRAMPL